jgi:hypothetical protein
VVLSGDGTLAVALWEERWPFKGARSFIAIGAVLAVLLPRRDVGCVDAGWGRSRRPGVLRSTG